MDDKVTTSAAFWDAQNLAPGEDVTYWLAVPEIRAAVNRRLTGDPDRLFISAFVDDVRRRFGRLRRVLSLGCGAGELERGLVGHDLAAAVEGVDAGAASIGEARRLASGPPYRDRLTYHRAEAGTFLDERLRRGVSYDLIFCHAILHHVEDLEGVVGRCARLLSGGAPGRLYVDEYVGPSRDEWVEEDLGFAAGLFREIPAGDRRTPHVWPPIAAADPTEMIRSSEIPAVLVEHFEIETRLPYYGNVLMPLVNAIRASRLREPACRAAIAAGLALEEHLAAAGVLERPLYSIFVGRPAAADAPGGGRVGPTEAGRGATPSAARGVKRRT